MNAPAGFAVEVLVAILSCCGSAKGVGGCELQEQRRLRCGGLTDFVSAK